MIAEVTASWTLLLRPYCLGLEGDAIGDRSLSATSTGNGIDGDGPRVRGLGLDVALEPLAATVIIAVGGGGRQLSLR